MIFLQGAYRAAFEKPDSLPDATAYHSIRIFHPCGPFFVAPSVEAVGRPAPAEPGQKGHSLHFYPVIRGTDKNIFPTKSSLFS